MNVRADLRDEDWRGPCCIARDVTRPARLVQRVVIRHALFVWIFHPGLRSLDSVPQSSHSVPNGDGYVVLIAATAKSCPRNKSVDRFLKCSCQRQFSNIGVWAIVQ